MNPGFSSINKDNKQNFEIYSYPHNIKNIITNKYADIPKRISSLFKGKLLNISIDGAIQKHRKFFGTNTHTINNKIYTLNLGITDHIPLQKQNI